MIPDIHRPATLADALRLHGGVDGSMYLAGGATLMALLNAGLVEPDRLICLDRVAGLGGIALTADGSARIGGMTRHRTTAASSLAHGHRVVAEAAAAIASPAIRSMGTMGGSVAFADPGADYPAALVAAAAVIRLRGPAGLRAIAAEDFFVDWYATGLEPGELVEAIVLPPAPATSGGAYVKLSRVEGDYATASAAAVVDWRQGRCHAIRIAVGGCGPTPVRVAEDALIGSRLDAAAVADLGRRIAAAADPVDDMRGSAGYRRRVIPVLVGRAVAQAAARAEDAA